MIAKFEHYQTVFEILVFSVIAIQVAFVLISFNAQKSILKYAKNIFGLRKNFQKVDNDSFMFMARSALKTTSKEVKNQSFLNSCSNKVILMGKKKLLKNKVTIAQNMENTKLIYRLKLSSFSKFIENAPKITLGLTIAFCFFLNFKALDLISNSGKIDSNFIISLTDVFAQSSAIFLWGFLAYSSTYVFNKYFQNSGIIKEASNLISKSYYMKMGKVTQPKKAKMTIPKNKEQRSL